MLKVERAAVVAMCEDLGFAAADKWNANKMKSKLREIVEMSKADSMECEDEGNQELLNSIVLAKAVVELVDDANKEENGAGVSTDEVEPEEEEAEEDEDEEDPEEDEDDEELEDDEDEDPEEDEEEEDPEEEGEEEEEPVKPLKPAKKPVKAEKAPPVEEEDEDEEEKAPPAKAAKTEKTTKTEKSKPGKKVRVDKVAKALDMLAKAQDALVKAKADAEAKAKADAEKKKKKRGVDGPKFDGSDKLVGVRSIRNRLLLAGMIIKQQGLAAGITRAMIKQVDVLSGKPNLKASYSQLTFAWHAINGYLHGEIED
jgi:hypothetical protein